MQDREDARKKVGFSSFTRVAISLLVFTVIPAALRNWLPSPVAAGVGALAACTVNYFLIASARDKDQRFTASDWVIMCLVVAAVVVIDYLRTLG
jgi:hypothetical protein